VNGRNALSWEEKFAMDVWYVDHQSLMIDIHTIASTISHLVRPEGISHPSSATMFVFEQAKQVKK